MTSNLLAIRQWSTVVPERQKLDRVLRLTVFSGWKRLHIAVQEAETQLEVNSLQQLREQIWSLEEATFLDFEGQSSREDKLHRREILRYEF